MFTAFSDGRFVLGERVTRCALGRGGVIEAHAKAEGDGSKTVYFEVSPLEYGLWTAGKGTFMDELAQMIGLKNAFEDVEGWAAISERR